VSDFCKAGAGHFHASLCGPFLLRALTLPALAGDLDLTQSSSPPLLKVKQYESIRHPK
jgi:hypothetical protein